MGRRMRNRALMFPWKFGCFIIVVVDDEIGG